MSTFLFYERDDEVPTHRDDLDATLESLGVEFDVGPGAEYRPGRWLDPHTGAQLVIDRGEAPLEHDQLHPPTAYAGWRPLGLTVHLPLIAPHWQAVEGLRWLERALAALPQIAVLDCEDNRRDDESGPGPFPFERLRALASWERQHVAHTAGRSDVPRLERRASLALWRYRQERAAGRLAHPDVHWPEALVLSEGATAISVALWADPQRALALPPVSFVVLPRAGGSGLLPIDEVLTVANDGEALGHGLARAIQPTAALSDLHQRAHLVAASRFAACADGEWSD